MIWPSKHLVLRGKIGNVTFSVLQLVSRELHMKKTEVFAGHVGRNYPEEQGYYAEVQNNAVYKYNVQRKSQELKHIKSPNYYYVKELLSLWLL